MRADLGEFTDDVLMDGDVTIDVEYSGINFKDGLALTGAPGIIGPDFLIAGIDLVGVVSESRSALFRHGDRVTLNGWGVGETHHGGLAERARVSADWLVAVPTGLSTRQAAAIGTAGLTAQLAVLALEGAGVTGDVLVTGAAGGLGSIATALLAGLGYRVTASTGRSNEAGYLGSLGAREVIDRSSLSTAGNPLQSQRWDGAVDSVGGSTLANVLAQTRYGGAVASCGLAGGSELPATVMPFILRAVTLIGINSVRAPNPLRVEAWARLARDLDLDLLESITEAVPLAGAISVAQRIVAGDVRGRTVVDVRA